jgi:probable rRNA maturation factor
MITVFNSSELLKIYPEINIEVIKNLLEEQFLLERNVNIIFVDKKHIQELNREYRKKDEVTDVLSFNIDSDDTLGEIYICPEYVINNISKEKFIEETIRLMIHGILHLQGFDHKKEFDEVDYEHEPMYIKQEQILNKILIEDIQK